MSSGHVTSYRTYAILWVVLLMLTLTMIFAEGAPLPRAAAVGIVLIAMMVKVFLIAGWYMHLRYERFGLIVMVAGGTLITAAVLFFLLVPDGVNIRQSLP